MNKLKVLVVGVNGRMGREVVQMVLADAELELVGGVDIRNSNNHNYIPIFTSLKEAIIELKPDVLVDFTTPDVIEENVQTALNMKVSPVIGTTGLTLDTVKRMDKLAKEMDVGGIIAPNFAIGAVLMMRFSQIAAKYMPNVEIIEMHHDQKLDAPSGTALKTAELIASVRKTSSQGHPDEKETILGARGGEFDGMRIHSVRLPGLVAHQEVIFGDMGQTLTIRHDSINRESFMPGVNLAIKRVKEFTGIIYGLEHILD